MLIIIIKTGFTNYNNDIPFCHVGLLSTTYNILSENFISVC